MGLNYEEAVRVGLGHLHPDCDLAGLAAATATVVRASATLVIPDWRPATVNELLGRHWASAARLKKKDRQRVWLAALACGTPPAAGRRRVDLLVRPGKNRRRVDGDALFKSTLDALVHAKLLVNDTVEWCVPGLYTPTLDGPPRTEITLTDL